MFVKHKKMILSYRMGQKLSSKLLLIYSPNSDGFYIIHISQGSVATQLWCGGMFGNHVITNFPQNATVKFFSVSRTTLEFDKDMDKTLHVAYFFGPPNILPKSVYGQGSAPDPAGGALDAP